MFEHVKADIRRVTKPEPTVWCAIGAICFTLGLHAVLLYRLSRWLHAHRLTLAGLFVTYLNTLLTGAQISRRAVIGKGLAILHPQGLVVGATTVIGDSCTLVHGNTIGQHRGDGRRPTIGSHFFAGAGARILGGITIGDNVRVGANAVVTRSVPSGATVVARGSRIIDRKAGAKSRAGKGAQTIYQRLLPLLESVGVSVASATVRRDLDIDSVAVVQLICAVEREFGLTVPEDAIDDFQSIDSLVSFIARRGVHEEHVEHSLVPA